MTFEKPQPVRACSPDGRTMIRAGASTYNIPSGFDKRTVKIVKQLLIESDQQLIRGKFEEYEAIGWLVGRIIGTPESQEQDSGGK